MRILFYGDSNTYGYDPRGPIPGRYDEDKIWPVILSKLLGEQAEVFFEGRNGRRIPRTDFEYEVLANELSRTGNVDILGIMLGTNDYLAGSKPNLDLVNARMESLLSRLQADYPRMEILLMAPPPIVTAHISYMEAFDTSDGCLSKAYRKLAKEHGILFFDMMDKRESRELAFDGVHLSEEGHKSLSVELYDYIKEALEG